VKILIIANQRSGSTIFGQWMAFELGYTFINEPNFPFDISQDNIVVKDIEIAIHSKNIQNSPEKYDKIIGLVRNDTFESSISLLYCEENLNTYDYHGPYSIDQTWKNNRIEEIKKIETLLITRNNHIKSLQNILQCTYENIFQNKDDIVKIKNYLGVEEFKYLKMLDKTNRYRNSKKMI